MKSDRHDPDAAPVHQDEFWGEQSEWTPQRRPTAERRGLGSTIGRWWDGLLGGGTGAEHARRDGHRAHGRPSVPPTPNDPSQDRSTDDLGHDDGPVDDPILDTEDDAWTFEPEPRPVRRLGADPLLTRFGGLAVIVTLAAPLLVGFTSSGSDSQSADSLATIASAPSAEISARAPTTVADPAPTATTATAVPAPVDASPTESTTTETDLDTATTSLSAMTNTASLEAAPVAEPAIAAPPATAPAASAPACGDQYELASGDYWIRIADAADVSLADLLSVNGSSVDTMLVPGRSICLPVGASTPPPPATTAPATTVPATTVPASTVPATTVAPTRSAPATTAPRRQTQTTVASAPTTTAPARPTAVPESQASAIIRQVWPDELEDRAVEIAWRESNHKSNVNNHCCYGLFQIYFSVHRSWLSTIGVTSAQDLFDPQLNAQAAYKLYQRAGGFGPWGG